MTLGDRTRGSQRQYRLVDSELGEIPEGWEMRGLDSIATFLNGLALQRYPANGAPTLPVITIRDCLEVRETMELPYRSIEGVTSSTGMIFAGIQITGRGAASYRIENVKPKDSPLSLGDDVRNRRGVRRTLRMVS